MNNAHQFQGSTGPDGPEDRALEAGDLRHESGPVPKPMENPVFVGNAMKALFETADVSIRRGDQTQVIGRGEADAAGNVQLGSDLDDLPTGAPKLISFEVLFWLAIAASIGIAAGYALIRGL